jgi:hypothetical protein
LIEILLQFIVAFVFTRSASVGDDLFQVIACPLEECRALENGTVLAGGKGSPVVQVFAGQFLSV